MADDALRKDGYVILDNVLPVSLVHELRDAFRERYRKYLGSSDHQDALKVGSKRYMITVELSGVFNNELVYANPCVLALLRKTLGEDVKLESFGVVLSKPGSKMQHVHSDGPGLFNAGIDRLLPAHAVTVVFPLIEMNETHGTTAIWPATHRKDMQENDEPVKYVVPEGSCAIWDFRVKHGGTENLSTVDRPVIYMTYARRWWEDPTNFKKTRQARVLTGDKFIDSVPEQCQHLFDHLIPVRQHD